MSDIIQLLPDAIANQIAAGEVIQRPASVVKELMENAIDAGATTIKLIVKDSGRTLIQVIDDGCGMSETDARLSLERHATSKIRKAEDLFAIRTMGFRGEALASIAAVAQLEMRTRRHGDELGTRLLVEGSEVKAQEPCQCAAGTSFAVKQLFFNVPARRNFLKSDGVEMRHINDEFTRIALANPDLFFSLHHNNSEVYHLPAGKLRQRIVGIFGQAYNKRLVPVGEDTDVLRVRGFVGKPEYSKKSRGHQFFFVNNRFIKSSYLHHAVMSAYEDLLPKDTYPFYVLYLDLDPARIDINVHPTKQEIKFEDERLIYNYLKVAIRHGLSQYSVMPTLDFEAEGSFSAARLPGQRPSSTSVGHAAREQRGEHQRSESLAMSPSRSESQLASRNLRHWQKLYEGLDEEPAEHGPITLESQISGEAPGNRSSVPAGEQKTPYQLHNTYIVSQIRSGFMLIDQQAAHERILYEGYLRDLEGNSSSSQQQLFPRQVEMPPADAALLREMLPHLHQLGFAVEEAGENAFTINGVPTEVAGRANEEQLLESLLQQFRANTDLSIGTREKVARAMARSAATKRGQALGEDEMRSLIDRLFACELPYRSPFGRHCFLTFELDELNRRFDS